MTFGVSEGLGRLVVIETTCVAWYAGTGLKRTSASAFGPSVSVLPNGTVGVTYYDLRKDDLRDTNSFLASYWLATSLDGGANWTESGVGEPFNLRTALLGDLYFLGD